MLIGLIVVVIGIACARAAWVRSKKEQNEKCTRTDPKQNHPIYRRNPEQKIEPDPVKKPVPIMDLDPKTDPEPEEPESSIDPKPTPVPEPVEKKTRQAKKQNTSPAPKHKPKKHSVSTPKQPQVTYTNQNLRKIGRIFTVASGISLCPICQESLGDEEIKLAIFKSRNDRVIVEYFRTFVISCPTCKRCFVTPELLKPIDCHKKGRFVDRVDASTIMTQIQTAVATQEPFRWPTTHLKVTKLSAAGRVNYKQESELHRLGYKITGMSRAKRWFILEQIAVPQLGLKTVATIIATNVRNRKMHKNGIEKNAYAIAEWEYDLQKLKDMFYKGNFVWPQT